MTCVVYGCSNNNFNTADPSVHYYLFPKHPIVSQQWMDACGWSQDQVDIDTARICSIHFDESCYTTEVKMIDYITCYTKVLKFDSVPTLYLPTPQVVIKQNESPEDELREMIVFTVPQLQQQATTDNDKPSTINDNKKVIELQIQPITELSAEDTDMNMDKYNHISSKEELLSLKFSNQTLRDKIVRMENSIKSLKSTISNQVDLYNKKDLELSNLHQDLLRVKRSSLLSLQDQKILLAKVFSESQIKILSGKKKIYWSNDDMAVGYTIRHLSNRRCYMYLTKKLNIPLPAVSSIKRWMTQKTKGKSKNALPVESNNDKNEDEDTD